NNTLQRQVSDLTSQSERLLAELEQNTRRRLADEHRVAQLTEQIASSQAQITALGAQLAELRKRIDPDVEQLEEQLRQQLENNYRRRLADATAELLDQPPTVSSVISQLGDLTIEERMALISVQGQYGSFLDSLSVGADRKEKITEALVELNLSQAQARQDLVSQGLEPQELARQMMALMSPEATRDTLAYDLTDEELAAFDAFQDQRQGTFSAGALARGGVYMIRGEGTNGPDLIQQGDDIFIEGLAEPGQARRLIIRDATPSGPDQ
ncbi:MAG: hypothetical protein VKI81_10295, partial [Synechococcaceae cyanobacterium]|nr:hypothetical protein [Synechococcaceae cyanobacterium]